MDTIHPLQPSLNAYEHYEMTCRDASQMPNLANYKLQSVLPS